MQMSASRNPSTHPSAGHPPSSHNRLSSDMKGRAPLPVPPGPQLQNGHSRNPSGYDMAARSPPNQSNTKHVPCKFFRQGACQAGPACPFLHSTDAAIEYAPCKYFTKGNCKFGAKCALAHILPDGRRVNRPSGGGMGMGGSHLNLGGRVNPQAYVNQDSALTNSVLSQQRMNGHDPRYVSQLPSQEEFAALHPHPQPQPQPYDTIPSIDTGLASDAGSKYGSPVEELRYPMSPNHNQYLTALDAPLPASFDSQGISHAARYGPVAASVPSRFGLDLASPPAQRTNPPRTFRDPSWGADVKKPASSFMGSSPPGTLEDGIGSRFLHSQRSVKSRMLSASVPRPNALDDWEDSNFPMEEDYLPMNLHDDVLTPQERLRRLSRTDNELGSSHRDLSGLGMSTSFSKVNSPLASSPSRFGALFAKQRQQKKEEEANHGSLTHIGSPLRESSLHFGGSPSLGPIGSPPRTSSASMIAQQLSGLSLHPSSARHSPSVATISRLDRTVSSPVSASKIEEEQEQGEGDLVFSMEEEDSNKRTSNEETASTGKNV
ncbi:hypothetical protein BDW74DRAFT_147853 [Aspergillus multicolor]|uniref:putative spindle poison sensitivity protein Scp3 n=1 Tax=Aspergillus multicolor TaxID=41759 RepID=UPI003CCDDFAD